MTETSETYIKMSDCPEIQEAWEPKVGDWLAIRKGDKFVDAFIKLVGSRYYIISPAGKKRMPDDYIKARHIWLPRQDQLQAMLDYPLWKLNWCFAKWLFDVDDDGRCDFHVRHDHLEFNSMEQLWLAFVMNEKRGKVWNGEAWQIASR